MQEVINQNRQSPFFVGSGSPNPYDKYSTSPKTTQASLSVAASLSGTQPASASQLFKVVRKIGQGVSSEVFLVEDLLARSSKSNFTRKYSLDDDATKTAAGADRRQSAKKRPRIVSMYEDSEMESDSNSSS